MSFTVAGSHEHDTDQSLFSSQELLLQGAIMSRFFVECFHTTFVNARKTKVVRPWFFKISDEVYEAVIKRGKDLYQNTLNLDYKNEEDFYTFVRCIYPDSKRAASADEKKDVLEFGRFACFGPSLPTELWERIILYSAITDLSSLSLVSRQHHNIINKSSLQARYFLKHYRRCEAIYQASCRPCLFTPDLLNVSCSDHS